MGQTLSSETFSISGGDGYKYWVGLTMKPSDVGCKKTVYKGVLIGHGPRQWEKVVAKAFTHIPGTKTSWTFELNKADVTKQLAAKFKQEYPSPHSIRIVIPGIVQMDRVSNVNKWLAAKNNGRGLAEDEWISVEELIPGKMGRYCLWSTKHAKDIVESKYMEAFSHFTYKYTNGELVACDFQGIYKEDSSQYIFTDSSIHSIFKLYGLFDEGEFGIFEFFKLHKCNEICNGWLKPTPSTPPPSFEAACAMQNNLTPASAYENIIFPTPYSENMALGHCGNVSDRDVSERRRHCSEQHRSRHAERLWAGHSVDFDNYERHQIGRAENQALTRGHGIYMNNHSPVLTRGCGGGLNNHPPPSYEYLSASQGAHLNQPPPYHSLVNLGGTSNSLVNLGGASNSLVNFGGTSNSLVNLGGASNSLVNLGGASNSLVNLGGASNSLVNIGGTGNNLARVLLSRRYLYEGHSGSLNQLNNVGTGTNVDPFLYRPRSATDPLLLHDDSSPDCNCSGACGTSCNLNSQAEDQISITKNKSNQIFDESPVIVPSAPPEEG